ncbi:MAG: hypothetical protein M3340_17415 [Actinomycetota bacterium]|nr:hypothetical protein [Actinomycetota bacterium]
MPHLFRTQPVALKVVLAGIVPALFGAVTGWALGADEIAYTVLALSGIAGGYFAGLEHDDPKAGALRGLVGGTLFGAFILLTNELIGEKPEAELLEPHIILVGFTAGFGVLLGVLGARRRRRREAEGPGPGVDFKRLHWAEFVGFGGVGILLASMFLPWFSTSCERIGPATPDGCNPNSILNGKRGEFNAFETFAIMDVLLVMACIAPFVLAYLVVRQSELSWRPGEITMIVGMTAAALIWLNGIILGRPGDSVDIGIEPGYWVGLVGANMILAGGLVRQALGGRTRKPPGTL